MSIINEIMRAMRITAVLWIVVAVIYPGIMLAVGQVAFPNQANGSLIKNTEGKIIGSALIGQPFTSDRYFNSRPSTTNYSSANPQDDPTGILKTGVSGASNLAPSNPALGDRIQGEITRLKTANTQPTADLLYTSGSSLDPHITPETARLQIDKVAKARGIPSQQLETLINQNTDERFLGLFGEPGVNVLRLNLALDALAK